MAEIVNNMFLINAPAGSGKTTYIENTIIDILAKHPNKKILSITYTNRAKEELQTRIDNQNVTIDTIHSFLSRFISLYFSKAEVVDLYLKVFEDKIMALINKGNDSAQNLRYIEKNGELNFNAIKQNLKKISYNEQPFSNYYYGGLSHDDLLHFTCKLFSQFKALQKRLSNKFAYIFIDEYQDTSTNVLDIFYHSIIGTDSQLYLLGDKMQEIYNNYDGLFNNHLANFNRDYNLTINYRCSPAIIEVLNKIYNDGEYYQSPYKYYESVLPRICLVDISSYDINVQYGDFLQLFLFNRKRFEQIGAGDLYNALSEMEEYKFPAKYTPVDVLTDNTNDNPDKLFRILFCICKFVEFFNQRAYGKSIRLAKHEKTIFNHSLTDIKFHNDKINFFKKMTDLKERYYSNKITISEFIDFLTVNEYCPDTIFQPFIESESYSDVINIPLAQFVKLYFYLIKPKISTQHGVKGEGHDRVCFVCENSSHTPITNMYDFFELFCSEDINLTDFLNFYYSYACDLESMDLTYLTPASVFKSKKDDYIKKAQYILEKYQYNKYFSFCQKKEYEIFLGNPTATNARTCFKLTKTKGVLWAYKLFYVGCSRAKKELVILVDKEKIDLFKDKFVSKMTSIGFDVK